MSITGPYRKGKSYILSEVFDQPPVFPLGHSLDAETMGIWMWIVPGKFRVGGPIHFVSSHLSFSDSKVEWMSTTTFLCVGMFRAVIKRKRKHSHPATTPLNECVFDYDF